MYTKYSKRQGLTLDELDAQNKAAQAARDRQAAIDKQIADAEQAKFDAIIAKNQTDITDRAALAEKEDAAASATSAKAYRLEQLFKSKYGALSWFYTMQRDEAGDPVADASGNPIASLSYFKIIMVLIAVCLGIYWYSSRDQPNQTYNQQMYNQYPTSPYY